MRRPTVLLVFIAGLACAQVRISAPNTVPRPRIQIQQGRYQLSNASLVDLIATAWTVTADAVTGGPEWIALERWNVTADARPEALQALLKDRFRLRVRTAPRGGVVVDRAERPRNVTQAPAPEVKFNSATIRQVPQNGLGSMVAIQPGGTVRIGMTLKGLIQEAWGDLNAERIVGSPASADASYWRIEATAPFDAASPEGWNGPVWNGVDIHLMRMMLRRFLVERFHLSAHIEERLVDGYALVAAAPKLRKADSANRPGCSGRFPQQVTCRNVTLPQFAEKLSAWSPDDTLLFAFPPVADATRIKGRYDFTFPARESQIFDALLPFGLKLEARKIKAQVLVIDHIDESPAAN